MTPIQQAIAILEEDALTNRIERALEVLRGVPQTPKVRVDVLEAFLKHADKHGDTNSGDRWYRGAAWVWREAAKMIRLALPDADTRPDRNTKGRMGDADCVTGGEE